MNERAPAGDLVGLLVLLVGGVAGVVGAGAWLAAASQGHLLRVDAGAVLHATAHLGAHATDPRQAWPAPERDALPGPVAYWLATAAVAVTGAGVVALAFRAGRHRAGPHRRPRFGIEPRARWARRRDLAPLAVHRRATELPGRLVLGRVGRIRVATEDRARRARGGSRRGDRGAVCVIGPSRSGKTASLISGILEWSGPAVLSSVKTDLLGATIGWRRTLGDVAVFDPMHAARDEARAGWSPLAGATTVTGAQRVARALADAGPRHGGEHLDFFLNLAEALLWPLLHLATRADASMSDVVRWVLVGDRPTEGRDGEVAGHLRRALATAPDAALADLHAVDRALTATWSMDDRTRASVYATAQTLLRPWSDPLVAESAARDDISLDRLVAGRNTLYLCAPLHDQERLAPVFGGLVGDLLAQVYERAARGTPVEPLLIVLDEAGNTPSRWLPQVASTCAGVGVLLVTVWQSKAQIDAAYGPLADSVLTNHLSKLIYAGVSDPATGEYVARLLGDEDVAHRTVSRQPFGASTHYGEDSRTEALLPAPALRRLRPGHALLVHGTLPPAHLRSIPYYRDRRLAARSRTGGPS